VPSPRPRRALGGLPAGEFLHPLPLLALGLLAVNDHVLKYWLVVPRWLTGKLSDFAGLFYFPLLLTACWGCLRWIAAGQSRGTTSLPLRPLELGLAVGGTAVGYGLLKTSPAVAAVVCGAVRWVSGRPLSPVVDPTDLAALVMLPLAWLHGRRYFARTHGCQVGEYSAAAESRTAGSEGLQAAEPAREDNHDSP